MGVDREAVVGGDPLLELLEGRVEELDDPSTLGADQMVVVFVVAFGWLVANVTVVESVGFRQSAVRQELHRPIDRRQGDLWVLGSNLLQQVFDLQMPARLEEDVGDQLPLAGKLEAVLGNVGPQMVQAFVCFELGQGIVIA